MPKLLEKSGKRILHLDRYAGEWVVIAAEHVVAHDKTLAEAMRQASKKRLKAKPSVFLVPRKDEGPYLLFFA